MTIIRCFTVLLTFCSILFKPNRLQTESPTHQPTTFVVRHPVHFDRGALKKHSPTIHRLARKNKLPARLMVALIIQESKFKNSSISSKKAVGLMQITPIAARQVGMEHYTTAEQNLEAGFTYYKQLFDQFASHELALAAYNAGPTTVRRFGGIPPYTETQKYVKNILELRESITVF